MVVAVVVVVVVVVVEPLSALMKEREGCGGVGAQRLP
jgi:hypothetical protein